MSDAKILKRDDFLKAVNNFRRELVEISIGLVYVAELSAAQMLAYNERLKTLRLKGKNQIDPKTSVELMALMVSMAVCDEDGIPLFTEADVKALSRANLNDMMTLSIKAMELSGMEGDAVNEVKEQLKKNRKNFSPSS